MPKLKTTLLALTALLTLPLPALAFDPTQPATLHISLTDATGRPVPDASIHLDPSKTPDALTNAAGTATLPLPLPPSPQILWREKISIEKPGLLPQVLYTTFFPGADIDQSVTLLPAHPTLIHITDSAGKPVPHAQLSMSYSLGNSTNFLPEWFQPDSPRLQTDDRGTFLWQHPPLPAGFTLFSSGRNESFDDAPEVTLPLTDFQIAAALSRQLNGRLLLPDASPAIGWFVAQSTGYSGGSVIVVGGSAHTITGYVAQKLIPIAPDGSFSLQNPTSPLFVVSPQGVPLVYDIAPYFWTSGTHTLTLTLPKFSSSISGTILDDQNNPVPNLALFLQSFRPSQDQSWSLAVGTSRSGLPFNDHGDILKTLTDSQGRFNIPIPQNIPADLKTDRSGYNLVPSSNPNEYHLQKSTGGEISALTAFKHITLHFVDDAGQPITLSGLFSLESYAGKFHKESASTSGQSLIPDRSGLHCFLQESTDSLKIKFSGGGLWNPFERTIALNQDDQVIPITLTSALKRRPLTGIVLDPKGQPAPNIQLFLPNFEFALTNDNGQFHFDGTPSDASIRVTSQDAFTWHSAAPGWSPPVPITGQNPREIRLRPFGSLRILLPEAFKPSTQIYLSPDSPEPAIYGNNLHFDPATHTLQARSVVPSTYHITDLPELPEIASTHITITPEQTTLLDLRKSPLVTPTSNSDRWATLQVLDPAGKPLPGIQVEVLSDQLAPKQTYQPEHFQQVTSDLSDDTGTIRFRATPGHTYTATARLLATPLASQKFTLNPTPTKDADATLTLQPQ